MFPLVISFYTKDTPYQLDAHHLTASCQKFGIEHHIEGINSYGSWELNCAFKPFFIAEKLMAFKRPVLWVDVDAVFVQKPKSLKVFEKDFAVYSQADLSYDHPSKVRSGTVFINHTERGFHFLKTWAQECQTLLIDPARTEEFWDQIALRNVYLSQKKNLGRLPLSYIKILGHPVDVKCPNPVIIHCQASRHAKKG
ncbi:MAG TPA: putative nucleotide-diphospho-sugar transferase [Rhabdochlamydiaceae bacterium]|nr:putative nucleotide-diphospho-sugar transferase [Rhabdochlamydiaceae bacterium]